MLRIALAALHLIGLSIAVGAIYSRARAFNNLRDHDDLQRGFHADNWWGISAAILLATGLWRAIGGLEKTPSYYWSNLVFYVKMALFVLIIALEIPSMLTLVRWRASAQRGDLPGMDVIRPGGSRIARISNVQTILLVGIVIAAVTMARGYGAR